MKSTLTLLLALLLAPLAALHATTKPNIIVVLSDDVGLSRVSCYGAAPFQTPHLDKLAATGLRFERCYSMPLCGPSRGALLTGKYPFRTGYLGNNSSTIDPKRHPTIANVLQQAGYATCAIGKLAGRRGARGTVFLQQRISFRRSRSTAGPIRSRFRHYLRTSADPARSRIRDPQNRNDSKSGHSGTHRG